MKRIACATALAAACTTSFAATPTDVPRYKCEPVPKMPPKSLMTDKMVRRTFDNDLKLYKECMNKYLEDRNATIKAHQEAANAAINDYNGVMKSLNESAEDQKGGSGDGSKTSGNSPKY